MHVVYFCRDLSFIECLQKLFQLSICHEFFCCVAFWPWLLLRLVSVSRGDSTEIELGWFHEKGVFLNYEELCGDGWLNLCLADCGKGRARNRLAASKTWRHCSSKSNWCLLPGIVVFFQIIFLVFVWAVGLTNGGLPRVDCLVCWNSLPVGCTIQRPKSTMNVFWKPFWSGLQCLFPILLSICRHGDKTNFFVEVATGGAL